MNYKNNNRSKFLAFFPPSTRFKSCSVINKILLIAFIFLLSFNQFICAKKSDPLEAKQHITNAEKLFKEKKYREAIIEAKKAEGCMPKDGWYAFNIGELYYLSFHDYKGYDKIELMEKAIYHIDRGIEKGYETGLVYSRRGMCYFKTEDYENSESSFLTSLELLNKELKKLKDEKEIISKKKVIADVYSWLTKIYYEYKDYESYINAVEVIKKYDPGNHWLKGKIKTATYYKAELALFEGNYDEAIKYYTEVGEEYWLDICKKRKEIGDVQPEYIHKIGVLYIRDFTTDYGDHKSQKIAIKDYDKSRIQLNQKFLKIWVETYSEGKLSLSFEHFDVHSVKRASGRHNENSPFSFMPDEKIYESTDRIDTYVITSPTISPGLGGEGNFMFFPYLIQVPTRGSIRINSTSHGFGMWLHEFFHVLECMLGIQSAHGFRPEIRDNFPDWKGETEEDYYISHFQTTLKKFGWKNLNYVEKYPINKIPIENFTKLKEIYKDITVWEMGNADFLTWDANDVINEKPEEGLKLLKEALSISPYHLSALKKLAYYYHYKEENKEEALKYYKKMELILPEDEMKDYYDKLNKTFSGN